MDKNGGLLERIKMDFNISKGILEKEDAFKARIVYSVAGRMGYSSLFDIAENIEDYSRSNISIQHFKLRIKEILEAYLSMYPEIRKLFPGNGDDFDELVDEMYSVFLHTGTLYHKNNRIAPSAPCCSKSGKTIFTRGLSFNISQAVSGIGTYLLSDISGYRNIGIREMYDLPNGSLVDFWNELMANTKWIKISPFQDVQYLRTEAPFTNGYWSNSYKREKEVSLLRIGHNSGDLKYYLYKFVNKDCFISEIPSWMLRHKHGYRRIANACLCKKNSLPKTKYRIDCNIVYIELGYLYPLEELNLLKLYSWPGIGLIRHTDFKRVMSYDVFIIIKNLMEKMGYEFLEVKANVE